MDLEGTTPDVGPMTTQRRSGDGVVPDVSGNIRILCSHKREMYDSQSRSEICVNVASNLSDVSAGTWQANWARGVNYRERAGPGRLRNWGIWKPGGERLARISGRPRYASARPGPSRVWP